MQGLSESPKAKEKGLPGLTLLPSTFVPKKPEFSGLAVSDGLPRTSYEEKETPPGSQ